MHICVARTFAALTFAAAAGGGLVACSTSPSPAVTIYMSADSSGYVGSGTHREAVAAVEPVVGDVNTDTPGIILRGLLEFPLDTIPAGTAITSATLRVAQCLVVGDPYTVHGNVYIDHVVYADPFDTSAYDSAPLGPTLGVLSSTPAIGHRSLVVTSAVQADLNAGRKKSQFRLSMPTFDTTTTDTSSNYVVFNTIGRDSHTCPSPTFKANPALIVTYH